MGNAPIKMAIATVAGSNIAVTATMELGEVGIMGLGGSMVSIGAE